MDKGEEKCQGTKDKCVDEIHKFITETSPDERNGLIMEYLNSYKTSEKIENFLLSLIF